MAKSWNRWKPEEIAKLRSHPEMTAGELSRIIPRHSEEAIRQMRSRMGRYSSQAVPTCAACGQRPVWVESPRARKYGFCEGCFLEEERRRLEDAAKYAAVRQLKTRVGRKRRGEA